MDFNRLTIKSQEAVGAAQELARRSGNPEIYPEHLVLALLDQELPRTLVERAGASVADVRARASSRTSTSPPSTSCSRSTSSRATRSTPR
jgi:ATP-dependent Clp protease ATP-binding subunit ClpB